MREQLPDRDRLRAVARRPEVGQIRPHRSIEIRLPASASCMIAVATNGLEIDAMWNGDLGVTGSRVSALRTPNPLAYTSVSPLTMPSASPGTPKSASACRISGSSVATMRSFSSAWSCVVSIASSPRPSRIQGPLAAAPPPPYNKATYFEQIINPRRPGHAAAHRRHRRPARPDRRSAAFRCRCAAGAAR